MEYSETASSNQPPVMVGSPSLESIAQRWKEVLAFGIFTAVAGLLAILLPGLAALAVELVLGALLLISGGIKTLHAFHFRGYKGFGWALLDALVSLTVGALLLIFPLTGVLTLALLIALFFLIAGITKCIFAVQIRPLPGSGWLGLSGVMSFALGVLILFVWPESAPVVIGILIGIDLCVSGWWLVMLALVGRQLATKGV